MSQEKLTARYYCVHLSQPTQSRREDKVFFEELETGSEQTRTVPVFCNWKMFSVGKTRLHSQDVYSQGVSASSSKA